MSPIAYIALNTYRETIRDKVLYNLVLFALIMIGSSYILSQISIYQEVKIIKDLGLASIAMFGSVIAVFIGIGLVSKEIDKRTVYSLLPKPVSRVHFILGKYGGLCLTLAVNVTIMTVGFYALLFMYTHTFEPSLLEAIYLIYLELMILTALALLFSTFTSAILSGVMTGFLYVVGHFSADLKHFDSVVDSSFLPQLTRLVYYLVPNLRNFDVKSRVVAGDVVPLSFIGYSTAYAVLYVSILLVLAAVIFKRRNLK